MARYIKTEDAMPYLTKYIPSVEAVERSKVDKAIKDIAKLSQKTKTIDEYELIGKCITIIKRNIGE